jgi:hypothetical protein
MEGGPAEHSQRDCLTDGRVTLRRVSLPLTSHLVRVDGVTLIRRPIHCTWERSGDLRAT